MKNLLSLLLCVGLAGCVSATVTEPDVCDTASLGTIPASPVGGLNLPPVTFTTPSEDYSTVVSKVQSVASNLSADVSQLTIDNNGDLDWVTSVSVTINGPDMSVPLATYASDGQTPGSELVLDVVLDQATLLGLLAQPFTLTFTISGTAPTQSVTLTNTLCVGLSGKFSKSL
jgi:hypothetical protein